MKKKKNRDSAAPDEAAVLELFANRERPLRPEGILDLLDFPASAGKKLEKLLRSLAARGRLKRMPGGFWAIPENSLVVSGEFNALAGGAGRVRVSEPADYARREIFISPLQTGGAWHKDKVRAAILPHSRGYKGKILEIVERTQTEIPAVFESRQKKYLRFRAADGRLPLKLLVPAKSVDPDLISPGDLALLKPDRQTSANEWRAELARVFGPAGLISAQESIVKLSQKVPGPFPPLAMEQAEALPPEPQEADLEGRENWRALPFVTIDGADARDFDDAIHVEKNGDGWILRVAIADVSHYARPDKTPGSLDAEALARGNSWYFPRSVEPMLPEALSNGLCSLKPDRDRLAVLAEMPFDKNGEPEKPRFAAIVMRSAARLTYPQAERFFKGDKSAAPAETLWPMLEAAYELYKVLARRRRERGTLNFFLPEASYEFDEAGALVKMGEIENEDSRRLIEEFMIAANEAVANYLGSLKKDFLYRVHPGPEQEKLARLYETLKLTALERLPGNLYVDGAPNPDALREILAKVAGSPEEYAVNRLCLRSMAQARYQPQNIGHFGLASPAYCHFTSPIRRYADLLVHRVLKNCLGQKEDVPDREELARIGDHLNDLERRAAECEREMAKRLACIYLQGKEGQIFKGAVSGAAEFGLFVEFADFPAEGLIRVEELGNDWFRLDAPTQTLIGMRGGRIWRLGQPVSAKLLSVDLEKQEIRLAPVEKTKLKIAKPARPRICGKEKRGEHKKPARSPRWRKDDRKPARSRKRGR